MMQNIFQYCDVTISVHVLQWSDQILSICLTYFNLNICIAFLQNVMINITLIMKLLTLLWYEKYFTIYILKLNYLILHYINEEYKETSVLISKVTDYYNWNVNFNTHCASRLSQNFLNDIATKNFWKGNIATHRSYICM